MYLGIFLVGTTPFDNAAKGTENKMLQSNRENREHLKYVRNVIPVQSHVRNPLAKMQGVYCCLCNKNCVLVIKSNG